MRVTLVVAAARNGVIGRDGKIPWHIPEDLKRFKRLTMGHPIIMGRKTWESIGRPLPGRESIVVTRQATYHAPGATVVGSLESALDHARSRGASEAFVIGGGELYAMALPRADRVELTRVHADFEGDARFPALDDGWIESAREDGAHGDLRFTFLTLDKR